MVAESGVLIWLLLLLFRTEDKVMAVPSSHVTAQSLKHFTKTVLREDLVCNKGISTYIFCLQTLGFVKWEDFSYFLCKMKQFNLWGFVGFYFLVFFCFFFHFWEDSGQNLERELLSSWKPHLFQEFLELEMEPGRVCKKIFQHISLPFSHCFLSIHFSQASEGRILN